TDHPGKKTDKQAEIQSQQRKTDRIIYAEDQAKGALAPDEAGNRPIDFAGDLTDILEIVAWDPGVDLGNHPVPIEQNIEGDHRRDDEQGDDVDDCLAGVPQLRKEAADEAHALGQEPRQIVLDRIRLALQPVGKQGFLRLGDKLLELGDVPGKTLSKV